MPDHPLLQSPAMAPQELNAALTLPAQLYWDTAFHDLEQRVIFRRHWQLAGHLGQLAASRSFTCLELAGTSIVLTRDGSDRIRAFHNVCRHRAGPLVSEPGQGSTLQCMYHGWTYDLAGNLKAAGEMQDARNFDKARMHLLELPCQTWNQMIFVALGQPDSEFRHWIREIEPRVADTDLADMRFARRVVYDLKCNWKVYVENYLEGYHLPYVHPSLNRMLSFADYQTHLGSWTSYQTSPIREPSAVYGSGRADYFFIFPNMMLNLLPLRCQTNVVLPVDSQRCRVVFDYFVMEPGRKATQERLDQDLEFSEGVQQEDIDICERVQRGLSSGAYHTGRISPSQEQGVWHFQQLMRGALRGPGD